MTFPTARGRGILVRAFRARPRDVAAACVLLSTHQLGEAMVPVIIGAAVGQAVGTGSVASLALWLALLAADFALLSLSYRFGARARTRASQHAAHAVRREIVGRALAPAGGADLAPGELLARASSDADRVGSLVGSVAASVAAAAAVAVASAFLLSTALVLGLLIVVGALALLAVVAAISRRLTARSVEEQHAAADATVMATDLVHGLRTLAGIGAGRAAADRYRIASRQATRTATRAIDAAAAISGVVALLGGLYLGIVAAVAGWLALDGQIALGRMISALGLAVFLVGPLQTLTAIPAAAARARASARRIAEILQLPPAVAEGAVEAGAAGRDAVRADAAAAAGASAAAAPEPAGAPEPAAAPDLAVEAGRLSFAAAAGALPGVAAADPADAGRLAALLAREHDESAASARWGGVDLRELPLEALRAGLVVSPHEAAVFDTSIGANVMLGGGALDGEMSGRSASGGAAAAALEAASAADADEIAASLPGGWDAPAGESGRRLSGGQRQRVALARALAARAPVLVLHEPTTAVDAVTEDRIADGIRRFRLGATTVLLTTSPALLARCDRVVLLSADGAREGTHAQLWASDAEYRALVAR